VSRSTEKGSMSHVCRVVVVESNKPRAATLSTLLEDGQGSFEVVHAWSLEAGATALCAVPVDVLLLEGRCLRNGLSEVARIRAHFKTVAIVVIVPRENEELGKQFYRAGACGYVLEEELDGALLRDIVRFAAKRKRRTGQSDPQGGSLVCGARRGSPRCSTS
jgi:DNA-binding NarL/FixJ family response regulator